jgi:hypothetical protein
VTLANLPPPLHLGLVKEAILALLGPLGLLAPGKERVVELGHIDLGHVDLGRGGNDVPAQKREKEIKEKKNTKQMRQCKINNK